MYGFHKKGEIEKNVILQARVFKFGDKGCR